MKNSPKVSVKKSNFRGVFVAKNSEELNNMLIAGTCMEPRNMDY